VNMPIAVTTERLSGLMTVWYALRAKLSLLEPRRCPPFAVLGAMAAGWTICQWMLWIWMG
jgi:hypothetical protein